MLSGVVSSSAKLSRAVELAEKYAPKNVTNMMSVAEAQQVMLQVRFAEVRRSAAKQLGINLAAGGGGSEAVFSVIKDVGVGGGIDTFGDVGRAAIAYATGGFSIDVLLEALEEKGQLRTLAEPNLVSLSGDKASFLAGGEFPIPVEPTRRMTEASRSPSSSRHSASAWASRRR